MSARSRAVIPRLPTDMPHRAFPPTAWVRQAEVDAGRGRAGALTTDEREELARLRRDVKRLQMERDILKKATAFFVKEQG